MSTEVCTWKKSVSSGLDNHATTVALRGSPRKSGAESKEARGGLERRSFHSAKAIELEEIGARVAALEKEAQVTEQTL
jgi:hypothetical protein